MLQRNSGPHSLSVPSIPAEVQPGETIDWPDPISGLEPADDDTPDPAQSGDTPDPEPEPPLTVGARRGGKTGKSTAHVADETPEEA